MLPSRTTAAAAAFSLVAALTIPIGLASSAAAAPDDPGLGDLARDAVVTASAFQDDQDGRFPPDAATDGNPNTRWASGNGPDEDVEWPQWLQLDLGEVSDLDSVRLVWEAAYATDYTVSVSDDGSTWNTAVTHAGSDGGTDVVDLPDGTQGRYVRLDLTGRVPFDWEAPIIHWYGYSLFSVEVWGTSEHPTVGFAGASTVVDAGSDVVTTFRLAHPRDVDTTLHVTSTDGTAHAGEDFEAVDTDVVIPAGQTTASLTVPTTDHGALAGDRAFSLAITSLSDGVRAGRHQEHAVTLRAHGDLPNVGTPAVFDDFEAETLPVFAWGADAEATPALSRIPADGRPGAAPGSHALQAQVAALDAGEWGGFSHDFADARDWSDADGFSFWFLGTGSGRQLRYELKSGGSSAGSSTLFETSFTDAEAGWQQVSVRFADLRKKGAPDAPDRFDPRSAWGYAVTLSDLGAGTWLFDDVAVVERAVSVASFEGDAELSTDANPVGVFAWGADEGSKPSLAIVEDDREGTAPAGNHVLAGEYQVESGKWGGFSHNLATPQNWSSYGGIRFWWYASQDSRPASPTAGADIRVELKDDGPDGEHTELWITSFKDNWSPDGSRWKLVELPFSQFTKRGDYQPGPGEVQNGTLDLTRAWGYALTMPTDTARTALKVDEVQVYGAPAAPVVARVSASPSVVLVDAGGTARVDLTLTTSDGAPLAEDVVVSYALGEGGTAVGGEDFAPFGGTVTFPAGAESGAVQSFEVVTTASDGASEALTIPVALASDDAAVDGVRVVVNAHGLPYLDPSLPVDDRVEDLLGRMSTDEKIGQMAQAERLGLSSPSDISALGLGSLLSGGGSVPADNSPQGWANMIDGFQREALTTRWQVPIIYGVDAVHGHNNVVGATLFPHNIGLGATRDPQLAAEAATVTATEVRATGVPWTFAPCLCVTRDERWGRSYESFGEDPALVTSFAADVVRGFQGNDPLHITGSDEVLATVKHWVGDGGTTYDESVTGSGYPIDQGITHAATQEEFEALHVSPYEPALLAGAGTVMPSYSAVQIGDGPVVRMHEHATLTNDVLKGRLGFDGFVISDWEGIDKLPGGTYPQKAVRAVNAGVDMAMAPYNYDDFIAALKAAVASGEVSLQRVDDAVARILREKFALGLFEQPFADRSQLDSVGSAEHRAVARQAAAASQVLLKNAAPAVETAASTTATTGGATASAGATTGGAAASSDAAPILPLDKAANVYVAGSTADDLGRQLGGWSISWQGSGGPITEGTTIGDAIAEASSGEVTISPDASAPMDGADVGVVVVGERPYAEGVGDVRYGAGTQYSLSLTAADRAAIDTVCGALDCVVLVVSGRPQLVADQLDEIDALVASWLPGTEGTGVADVLFGDAPFTGRLPVTWPRTDDRVPDNVGDASYDPQFAFGWGLRTDSARERLAALQGELERGSTEWKAVRRLLEADFWAADGTVKDTRPAFTLLQGAASALRFDASAEGWAALGAAESYRAADVVVSIARGLAQDAVVAGDAKPSHASLTADAEHALLTGEPGTAVRLLAAVTGVKLTPNRD